MNPADLLRGLRVAAIGERVRVTLPMGFPPFEVTPAEAAGVGLALLDASWTAGQRWWRSSGSRVARERLSAQVAALAGTLAADAVAGMLGRGPR